MKTLFFIISFLGITDLTCIMFSITGTYAQHFESLSECKSIEDTLRYLQHTFLEPKDKFVGKPAKEVIEAYRKILPIKCAPSHSSSPCIDEELLSYIDRLGLYYYELFGRPQKGKQIYFDIYFEDTHAEVDSFKKKIAEEDWDNYDRYVNYFQDFIVKEIDIHLWDWGTRKKIE